MAIGPIDYSSGGLSGLERGFKFGLGLRQIEQEQQAQEEQKAAQQKFGTDLMKAWESGDEKSLVDLVAANPGQMDTIKGLIGLKDDVRNRAVGGMASSLSTALESGNINGAANIIASNADLLSSMGQDPTALVRRLQEDPESLRREADSYRLMTMTPDQVMAYKQKLEDQQLKRDQMSVQMRGQDVQIRGQNMAASTAAKRLSFDKEKFDTQMQEAADKADQLKLEAPKLSVNMEKALDTSVADAAASRSSAASLDELANRWSAEKPTAGLLGSTQSTWNKMTGSDSGLRDLRIRTSQVLNSQALKFLPPGPATDRDVELAREGVPTNMDDPALVSNWLKAQARNERRVAAFNDFRAEWISAQGNPGQAKADANISGLDVRKGDSFASAAKRYMKQAEADLGGQPQQVQPKSSFSDLWGN